MMDSTLGDATAVGLPAVLLAVCIGSFVWFGLEIRKNRITMKSMVNWFVFSVIFTIVVVYLFIIEILHVFDYGEAVNLLNLISTYVFGLSLANGKQWVIIVIFTLITYIMVRSLINTIKISRLDRRIDELNKQVAILMGKVNKTINLELQKEQSSNKDSRNKENLASSHDIGNGEKKHKEKN